MFENDACAIFCKPSATTYMKYDFAVTDGKVIDAPAFRETVGRKVMPILLTQVTLVKIDMDDAYFRACLIGFSGILFFYLGDFNDNIARLVPLYHLLGTVRDTLVVPLVAVAGTGTKCVI